MAVAQKWLVCEQSGRWAAALRSTFLRLWNGQSTPRLYEVRTIVDLLTHLGESRPNLVLIEVGRENLTEVLQLLVRRGPRHFRFAALLQDAQKEASLPTAKMDESVGHSLADLLWELGALEVVE